MKKKRLILPCLLAVFYGGMAHAQSYYATTYVRQNGSQVATDGTAGFDITSADAIMKFDSDGNAVMTIGGAIVAKVPCVNSDDSGELAGTPTTTTVTTNLEYTIPTGGYGTLYSPFQVQVPSGASFYVPKLNDGKNLVLLNSTNKVKTNKVVPVWTPLVIYGTAGTKFNIPFSATACASQTTDASFGGTTLATAFPTEDGQTLCTMGSVTKNNNTVYGFYKYCGDMSSTYKFPASKVWLFLDTPPSAKASAAFSFEDDTPTGIETVEASADITPRQGNGIFYNLAGQRVSANTKGILIINGKKIINR